MLGVNISLHGEIGLCLFVLCNFDADYSLDNVVWVTG